MQVTDRRTVCGASQEEFSLILAGDRPSNEIASVVLVFVINAPFHACWVLTLLYNRH